MKKLFFIAAMAALTLGAQAQEKLTLSTYNGTNIAKFDGKVCNVTVSRYVFNGWNTIALPFSMSEQELCDVFGSDCRLEQLVSADDNATGITLNFVDSRAQGLQANTPYMLYYTGETTTKRIQKEAEITDRQAALSFTTQSGDMVTMEAARKHVEADGLYGVLARDNGEVKFVALGDEKTSGFYATRCYIRLASGTTKALTARHIANEGTTSISAIATSDELVDVYTINGTKVASQVRAADVANMRPNVYIIKGQKVIVK